ncbi:MAG: DUF1592 domain-containing protein, partial [Myxococcota bacterium]
GGEPTAPGTDDGTDGGDDGVDDDGGSDGTDDGEPVDPDLPEHCVGLAPSVGPTPLRRLTRDEYNNVVADLLGDTTRPADAFAGDEAVGGFAANSVAPVSEGQATVFLDAAETLAATAVAEQLDGWLPCDHAESSCTEPFIVDLARRAFRRPLTTEESAALTQLYRESRDAWGADKGIEMALTAVLSSPQFLYHLEVGLTDAAEADAVPLTAFEIAARLSFYLWGSIPDDELFAAAEADALSTADEIEAQARRMLADPRASKTIDTFHRQWLELDAIDERPKDPDAFPEWSPALAAAMRDETLAFTHHVMVDGDAHLSTLLGASYTFADDSVAAIYGVPPSTRADGRVELGPNERSGILTHPSFLAGRAHELDPSWVLRGKFVRNQLMCQTLPPPPDDADFTEPNDPDRLTDPQCASCHTLLDPVGQGFDGYDAIGRFTGQQVQGEVLGGESEAAGPFDGPVALAAKLVDAGEVHACLADRWFVYATRHEVTPADACSMGLATTAFEDGLDLRELVVAITRTDAFRHRNAGGQ